MSEPDSYYLRGFVGSEYTGSGWESPGPAGLYQRASLFYWLHQDGFYGQTQLAGLTQLVDPSQQLAVRTVRNIGASTRYLYACLLYTSLMGLSPVPMTVGSPPSASTVSAIRCHSVAFRASSRCEEA